MAHLKTLIHLHTDYSYDSDISLESLARFIEAEGVRCVAITDHDTIEGARRFRHMTNARVIIGEEVTTRDGHLIGLFLRERVRPGMTARDTAIAIREQGGLVLLPHPFIKAFRCGLGEVSERIVDRLDAVEVNNAQNILRRPDRLADRFADRHNIAKFVGADAHMTSSIAPCYQMMPDFSGSRDFVPALRASVLTRGRHPLAYFAATGYRLMRNRAGLSTHSGFGANFRRTSEGITAMETLVHAG